ncbi:MAG: alpha/beta fold hydrolase [Candidatus Omnitrophica bacterium]|nr:alpha/beta fold hydrolase [Candidatus Omnitrophota bacterium]
MRRHKTSSANDRSQVLVKSFKILKIHAVYFFLIALNLGASPVQDDFYPAWWCRGGHLQTIAGALFRQTPSIPLQRERIETPDGDFLDLDWFSTGQKSPLVIILPGLGSSSEASYIRTLFKEIQNRKWQAVTLNARGTTGLNRLPKTSHGGQTEDLDWVIRRIIENQHAEKIFLVGYSIGGNQILKWLAEKGENVPAVIEKAVAVSVPYDLAQTSRNLDRGFNRRVYTRTMLEGLKKIVLEKEKKFPAAMDYQKVKSAATFKVYDREVTARLNGFQNESDYWTKSSSAKDLEKIRKPVLLIHAKNDPFLPVRDLPLEEIKKSRFLHLLLTRDGGHLGFVSARRPDWLEKTILEFLQSKN